MEVQTPDLRGITYEGKPLDEVIKVKTAQEYCREEFGQFHALYHQPCTRRREMSGPTGPAREFSYLEVFDKIVTSLPQDLQDKVYGWQKMTYTKMAKLWKIYGMLPDRIDAADARGIIRQAPFEAKVPERLMVMFVQAGLMRREGSTHGTGSMKSFCYLYTKLARLSDHEVVTKLIQREPWIKGWIKGGTNIPTDSRKSQRSMKEGPTMSIVPPEIAARARQIADAVGAKETNAPESLGQIMDEAGIGEDKALGALNKHFKSHPEQDHERGEEELEGTGFKKTKAMERALNVPPIGDDAQREILRELRLLHDRIEKLEGKDQEAEDLRTFKRLFPGLGEKEFKQLRLCSDYGVKCEIVKS